MWVGIIGCGLIAADHVAALRGVEGLDVVVMADIDAEWARAFARRHGVPHAYPDAGEMFAAGWMR